MLAPIQHWVNIYCDNFVHNNSAAFCWCNYLPYPTSFLYWCSRLIHLNMNEWCLYLFVQVRSDLHKVSHTFVVSLKAHLLNSITNHPDTVFLTHVFSLHHFYKSIQHQLFESNPFISSLNNYLPVSLQCFWHFQFSIQTILKQFC